MNFEKKQTQKENKSNGKIIEQKMCLIVQIQVQKSFKNGEVQIILKKNLKIAQIMIIVFVN